MNRSSPNDDHKRRQTPSSVGPTDAARPNEAGGTESRSRIAVASRRSGHPVLSCRVTGKPKSEISKLLAVHDKLVPAVQNMARSDKDTVLTKRHLYNISTVDRNQQEAVAAEVQKKRLTAIETEGLVQQHFAKSQTAKNAESTGRKGHYRRRFTTEHAEAVMTFRK